MKKKLHVFTHRVGQYVDVFCQSHPYRPIQYTGFNGRSHVTGLNLPVGSHTFRYETSRSQTFFHLTVNRIGIIEYRDHDRYVFWLNIPSVYESKTRYLYGSSHDDITCIRHHNMFLPMKIDHKFTVADLHVWGFSYTERTNTNSLSILHNHFRDYKRRNGQ